MQLERVAWNVPGPGPLLLGYRPMVWPAPCVPGCGQHTKPYNTTPHSELFPRDWSGQTQTHLNRVAGQVASRVVCVCVRVGVCVGAPMSGVAADVCLWFAGCRVEERGGAAVRALKGARAL